MQIIDIRIEKHYDSNEEVVDKFVVSTNTPCWLLYIDSELVSKTYEDNPIVGFGLDMAYWYQEHSE